MKKYPVQPERIYFAGFEAARRLKKQICMSHRYKYAWLRIDPCINLPDVTEKDVPRIASSKDISNFLHQTISFAGRGVEQLIVVCLNTKNIPLAVAVPHRGGRNTMYTDITLILQPVVLAGASAFIVAHNHPSQVPEPSAEDIALTTRLTQASKLLALTLLDHIILTDYPERYFSFVDAGLMS